MSYSPSVAARSPSSSWLRSPSGPTSPDGVRGAPQVEQNRQAPAATVPHGVQGVVVVAIWLLAWATARLTRADAEGSVRPPPLYGNPHARYPTYKTPVVVQYV